MYEVYFKGKSDSSLFINPSSGSHSVSQHTLSIFVRDGMICPHTCVEVLTPSTSECELIWKRSIYKVNQVKLLW